MKALQFARRSLNLVSRNTTRRCVSSNLPPPPDVHHWTSQEEPLEDYGPAGYHPTTVGDILGSQYRVLRKLGWGVYSTVWLVQNQKYVLSALLGLCAVIFLLHQYWCPRGPKADDRRAPPVVIVFRYH
jgi:hypothetical protein